MSERKVCHVVQSLGIGGGGPSRSISQLCDALVSRDELVAILTAVDPMDPIIELNPAIELIELPMRGNSIRARLKAPGFKAQILRIKSEWKSDVIHQHGIWLRSSHEVTGAASSLNIPLIVAPRGMLEPWALNHSKWKKKFAWNLYQKRDLELATAFHATALSEAESIRRLGFKQPIAVIPNGVQLQEVRDQRLEIENRNSDTKTALFLSRINPKKGLPMLLDAWKQLSPEGWRLIIAGNDDSNHLPVVEAKIAEHGLKDQVRIAGPLFGEDKDEAYRNADLFVLPSYSENFGIVVAEALGYQLPVLTTTGCPWQELQTKDCGWWVEPTPEGVLVGLRDALQTKPDELLAMGERGRHLVEESYLWPGIAERMAAFYEWVLNGGKQPEFVV